MCCFSPLTETGSRLTAWLSRATVRVHDTSIFARRIGPQQCLVYSMRLSTPSEVAMILPLPVVPSMGEAALEFVDLSDYPQFFEHLRSAFFVPQPASRGRAAVSFDWSPTRLVVHEVGAFEASFVPSIDDFERLDPRFRLPRVVFDSIPEYADYGFAVFQLKPGKNKQIHPMALKFHTRASDQLFFPTVHVHDGRFHESARFSHQLYHQGSTPGSLASVGPLGKFMAVERALGLIEPQAPGWQLSLYGKLPNRDTWIPS